MKYNLLIIILLIAVFSIAQKNEINPNGYNIFYYKNGKISSEGYMVDGKPSGYWKNYYPTGVLKSEGNRKNLELDSLWIFYDEDGDTIKKINYRMGKKSGFYYTYSYKVDDEGNKKGGLISKELYLNDVKNGKSFYYDPDEHYLKAIYNFKNNKKEGIGKIFAKDGRIITIEEYRNGVLINREYINRYNPAGLKQGEWKEFYPNDKPKVIANYNNGKLHGFYKEYEVSGALKKILKYDNGILVEDNKNQSDSLKANNNSLKYLEENLKEEYYPNGKIKSIGAYRDTIPVGEHKYYSEDGKTIRAKVFNDSGKLLAKGYYDSNGKKHGKWWYYYSSGNLKAEGNFVNGKRHGLWKFYYENGNIEQTGKYIYGKPDGQWQWFYENQKIKREENYKEGLQDSLCVEYDENGNILEKGYYKEGLKDGYWYYNVGDHIEEGNYFLGKREGKWKYYYSNGKLFFEGSFVQGEEDGKHKYYYDNGKLKSVGKYVFGSKEGKWYFYNYDGELIYEIKYKNDIEYKINGEKTGLI
ncbi:MAG: hypothetical protein Kow0068_22140 [Marinilabiliales bacterium]